jgi:competence protein ComEC
VALALAVNLTALPLTLYHFHKFPLMGFLYNLFFPFLVALCMLLLLLALASGLLLPWLGNLLHALNGCYTKAILGLVSTLPPHLDTTLYYSSLTTEALACYLLLLFGLGTLLYARQATNLSR